ncbi:methionine aminopeptidase 1D, chloroplastic/mitochondrial-like isoform X1 [Zingiber officinale]|uniref:methionine aminopeptidase 1D, chloroplastic/mitochondrial-like isoform X1 n=1 Tax=Zingiber officinale TaxID=94328 RepID=UPI001C4BEB6E|nr:methionine aminopeptidase 1D, chloroplastic/mitochondrial-like isoform X1 [Zingiber officinale]XP_042406421.1 methionine aminopeptidase 1D, chloroplastic/mitochondrial-like isoform X1 [Zingiber officinale]
MAACASPIKPRFFSSFFGDRLACPHVPLLHRNAGIRNSSIQFSRTLYNLADILFNKSKRKDDWVNNKYKRLQPGKISPPLAVPDHIMKPPYVNSPQFPGIARGPEIHDEKGMEGMRASGRLAAEVLEYAGTLVQPGTMTDDIDKAVHQMIIENGAYPSPLGYGGFPKSVCTSVNECICHGIPDSRPLEDGDIINIDVTVFLNGYHGDTSATFFCGNVDEDARQLVEVTRECLLKAISICAPGVEYNRIGKTIHDHADKFRFGVVRHFVGHGVGRVFHADPVILHYNNTYTSLLWYHDQTRRWESSLISFLVAKPEMISRVSNRDKLHVEYHEAKLGRRLRTNSEIVNGGACNWVKHLL